MRTPCYCDGWDSCIHGGAATSNGTGVPIRRVKPVKLTAAVLLIDRRNLDQGYPRPASFELANFLRR